MDATEVIAALGAPTADRRPLMKQLEEDAARASLAGALAAEAPLTRHLVADILGRRAEIESAGARHMLAAALGGAAASHS